MDHLLQLPPSPIYGSAFSAVRSLLSHSVSTPVAWHTYKGRSRTHEQSIEFVLRPEVVCTYIFVPFATVGLYTGSESLFGSDTLAPRAKDRQFPLGTRLLYFDTRTRTELGVPTLLRYAATTRSNYRGMRTKQIDARAQRRHISTRNPSTPARAPIYARASLFSLSIISPFSHLQQTFARSLSLNYSTQQFPPPIAPLATALPPRVILHKQNRWEIPKSEAKKEGRRFSFPMVFLGFLKVFLWFS